VISSAVGCKIRDIGYAGLKDKNAFCVQNFSLHKKYEKAIKDINHPNFKIINTTYHKNKIKIGHLKGNHFTITLKMVDPLNAKKLDNALQCISNEGMANYFGYQRFGINNDNHIKGEMIVKGKLKERNYKLKQMFINAYQSFVFNEWLQERIKFSKVFNEIDVQMCAKEFDLSIEVCKQLKQQKHFFKIFSGDIMNHYPFGRMFYVQDVEQEAQKFSEFDRVPTGLLIGQKTMYAKDLALKYEPNADGVPIDGGRRFAWVFPKDIAAEYKDISKTYQLEFFLPKGSYATSLIEQVLN